MLSFLHKIKSWYFNIPFLLFVYWDKEASVFEILLFDTKVFYFFIPPN